jgi:hypothetical protein
MSTEKPSVDREAIRALVRQVLRDALPEAVREKIASDAAKAATAAPTNPKKGESASRAAETGAAKVEEVTVTTDAELNVFARRLLAMEPKQREAVQAGRLKFRLRRARKSPETEGAARGGNERIDKGIVTEKRVIAAAKAGKRLVVGKGVVLTPLARDKARQLGVEIERE